MARERVSPDTLAAIADELFTLVGRHRQLIWLLDRCASEVGLGGIYETAVRRRLIDDFTSAIGMVLSGRNRSKEEISARARALFEMVVWMGMHRHRDRQPPLVTDDVARRSVIEIVLDTALGAAPLR